MPSPTSRNTSRFIFKQSSQLMGVVQPWVKVRNHGEKAGSSFRVSEGVKMIYAKYWYVEFLTDHFLPIFMHDNAPSHPAKNTSVALAVLGIKGEKFMLWPPSSPDLNPIENLWTILKQKIYEGGRQFTSKQQLWEAILTSCKEIQAGTLQKLTSSMNAGLVKVISKKGFCF